MIVVRRTGYTILDPGHIRKFDDQALSDIRTMEELKELDFVIPSRFQENKIKQTYQVGFLCSFLMQIYPMKNFSHVVEILNQRYNIFIGRRQIERLKKDYNSDEMYINN